MVREGKMGFPDDQWHHAGVKEFWLFRQRAGGAVGFRPPISSSYRWDEWRAKEVQQMATEEAIKVQFTAQLRKSPAKGGWSYVIWPESAAYFETRGLVKVRGTI